MNRYSRWGAGLAGSALLAGVALVGTTGVAQADAGGRISVEVCAEGNYTAYAKWVGGGLSQDETHVTPGTCFTDGLLVPQPNATSTLYLFGIDPSTHKGFQVFQLTVADLPSVSKILFRAQGTSSGRGGEFEAWGTQGQFESGNF